MCLLYMLRVLFLPGAALPPALHSGTFVDYVNKMNYLSVHNNEQ